MNTSSNDTRFLELLHKWRTGDFTRADEREMWALAADDPFRQEAMEGVLEHPELDHVAAVTGLRARIRGGGTRRGLGFPQILAVAAALVLIFGAIWFFNIPPIPAEQGQMAKELPAKEEAQQEVAAPIGSVSRSPTEIRGKSAPQTSVPEGPSMVDVDKLAKAERAPAIAEAKDDGREEEGARDIASDESVRTTPQPAGAVIDQSSNVGTPAERAKDEVGYAKKKSSPNPAPNFGQQQNQTQNQQNNAGKANGSSSLSNEPQEGWISFRLNLSNKARLTTAALANNVTGTVRLEFILDKKGQPTNFKVIQTLGYGCDEVAIQLIKDFPWTRVNDQKITVDVPFVR